MKGSDVNASQLAGGGFGVANDDDDFELVNVTLPEWDDDRGRAMDWDDRDWARVAELQGFYEHGIFVIAPICSYSDESLVFHDGNHRWCAAWRAGLRRLDVWLDEWSLKRRSAS